MRVCPLVVISIILVELKQLWRRLVSHAALIVTVDYWRISARLFSKQKAYFDRRQ